MTFFDKIKRPVMISVLICLMMCTIPVHAAGHESSYLAGVCLDISNRYYSVSQLKKYVDLASEHDNGYVQLHLTGDSSVGIECRTLGQKSSRRYLKGKNKYVNPKTGKPFLSYGQIRTILNYAKKKQVQIVPEIDMPGHMKGFSTLYRKKYGRKAAIRIFGEDQDSLQIKTRKALDFSKKIYKEYADLFVGCKYFHIGCDEFWDGDDDSNVSYINRTAACLKKKGFEVWIWNDLITNENLQKLDHDITVTYWSWDGDAASESVRAERRKSRASFTDIQNAGIRLLNYNSYYLYYVPSASNTTSDDRYMVQDLKENWNIRKWDGENGAPASNNNNIIGAAVSVWNEDSRGVSASRIYENVRELFKVLCDM